MTLKEIGEELVKGCREGREMDNLGRLYAEGAVSVEAQAGPDGSRETRGLEGIRGKHVWWENNFEVERQEVTGPFPHGNECFAVIFDVTARNRESGESVPIHEVAVYHVAEGRIMREEFFYG